MRWGFDPWRCCCGGRGCERQEGGSHDTRCPGSPLSPADQSENKGAVFDCEVTAGLTRGDVGMGVGYGVLDSGANI